MKRKIRKLNSRNIEEIIKEIDKIELEEKNVSFVNRRDVYVCPECIYLGTKCDMCTSC